MLLRLADVRYTSRPHDYAFLMITHQSSISGLLEPDLRCSLRPGPEEGEEAEAGEASECPNLECG